MQVLKYRKSSQILQTPLREFVSKFFSGCSLGTVLRVDVSLLIFLTELEVIRVIGWIEKLTRFKINNIFNHTA